MSEIKIDPDLRAALRGASEQQKENSITQRWRKGAQFVAVEESKTEVYFDGERLRGSINATATPETLERIRLGYLCIKCWEPQEQPFPKECSAPWCKYPMADQQREDFAQQFEGDKWIGPSTSLDWEQERFEDEAQRRSIERKRARGEKPVILVPDTPLFVPSWAKLD